MGILEHSHWALQMTKEAQQRIDLLNEERAQVNRP
jgi:hypothetical protein